MAYTFTEADLARIAEVLGVAQKTEGNNTRFELHHAESGRRIALEIVSELPLKDGEAMNLVSVTAATCFLQIQNCTGFIAIQELGEVIFFARQGGVTNGLVVEQAAGSTLYANVADKLLNMDFTQLPNEVMMSSVALSMTEDPFGDLGV